MITKEEAELYSSHIYKKPNISWTNWIAYIITAIILVLAFMFFSVVSCISDYTRPVSKCRDSLAGQTLSTIISKTF